MCDSITNGGPRYAAASSAASCCPPANVIIASNVLDTNGNVIAGNVISQDGTFTGNLYVSGTVISNISYSALNVTGTMNALYFSGDGGGLVNLNSASLSYSGVTAGLYGDAANVSQVTIDQHGLVTSAANVAFVPTQWTTVAGNIAYQNGVSIGTLAAPAPGSNLLVLGTANIDTLNVSTLFANSATVFGSQTLNVLGTANLFYAVGDGGGLFNLQGGGVTGNVAQANIALVVSQPDQPNITSVGTSATTFTVQGLLVASNGSGISNLNSANLVGNVARANVALVVSQPDQPNITSVGAPATTFTIQGLLVASNGSGISNLNSANLVGNVAQANVALVVSQSIQSNITRVGTLDGLYSTGNVSASFFAGQGNALTNIQSSVLVGNVASANVAMVVSQASQPNITQVGSLTGLYSYGNITATFFLGGGNALSNVQSSGLVGNVARANVALVVSQPAQPNITSVGALTSLTVVGSLGAGTISGDGVGLYGIPGVAIIDTVATANSVVQAAQPNITSVGALTGLAVSGLLVASNGSGIANLNASNLTSGTLNASRLPTSGVSSGLYGSGANVSQVTVDQYGRVTAAANIAITASQWTGAVGNPIYYQNFVGIGSTDAPTSTLMVTGNVYASNSVTTQNLFFTNSIQSTNLPTSGVTAGAYGAASNIPSVTVDQYGRITSASNVTLPAISQWTTVDANVAFANGVSIGTIANPPVGANLYVLGTALISNVTANGSGISSLNSANLVGNVAQANVALVVSQPDQPNVTSLGTLTGLNVQGLLIASNGSGISNLNSANLVGNVARANVALVVSQPDQPNITSVGTVGSTLTVQGLLITSNGSGISNLNSANLVGNVARANVALVVSQPSQPNITSVGAVGSTLTVRGLLIASNASGASNLNSANLVGNVARANIALVVSQNAQPNITSVGILTSLNVSGSVNTASLYVSGILIASNGSGISNLNSANLVGNVAQANVALVVSQPDQPNVTSLGTLTGLNVQGLLIASDASGASNLNSANLVGNVAQANVALVVSQADQPNVTSLGTLTGLNVQGLLIASDGSGISSLNSSNLVGNVAQANVALVVSQADQPNVTSLGTLTGLNVQGLLISSNGSGISNLNSANLVGNVAQANVALVVSQAAQPNITSVGLLSNLAVNNSVSTGDLYVAGNVLPVTGGNTYITGNVIVSGNVYSALGAPLGEGGGYYFSLPGDIALQPPYTGALYGTTYPLSVGLSNGWTITGTSTLITVTPNGNFKFNKAGAYKLSGVFQGSTDNITGLAVGSNVADIHGTDQGYMYRYTTFLTQNPTELIEIPFDVTDESKYYYLDLWCVDGGALKATATGTGGTYLTITPLQGGGLASGGPGGTPGTQWINSGSNIYFTNSVGIGAINPQYKLDVSGDLRVTGNIYGTTISAVATGLTSNYVAGPSDYYIGVSGARKVTLPPGSSVPVGKSYIVKDEAGNAAVTSVILQAAGSDVIDSNSNVTMALNSISLTVIWTGTRWSLI